MPLPDQRSARTSQEEEVLSLCELLTSSYGHGIEKQYNEFIDRCSFFREILTILYNEQRSTYAWDEAGEITDEIK